MPKGRIMKAIEPVTLGPGWRSHASLVLSGAWLIVLLLTVPEIILRGFAGIETAWMLPARAALLIVLYGCTLLPSRFRPLHGFVLILLVIYAAEGLLLGTLVPQLQLYQDAVGGGTDAAFLGERMLRIGAVVVMFLVLLGTGLKPRDFYLAQGSLRATAERDPFLRLPPIPQPWTRFGRNYALISTVILLVFLIPAVQPSLGRLSMGLLLFAAVCAALNAFAEEFLYRAALLPRLLPLFPKHQTLLLVATWFGLAHYFGVPGGATGVLLAAIGGWFLAKCMVETRGMALPWLLHFVSDFAVYVVILLAAAP